MSAPHLKYTFLAEFADGSFLEQTQADKPTWAMREDGGGSAFTDVLNPKSPLVSFTLVGDNREYGVDLTTLNFSVACGEYVSQFKLHQENDLPIKDIEIVYLRNVKQHADFNSVGEMIATRSEMAFRLGWKGKNLAGEEITKFIEFD